MLLIVLYDGGMLVWMTCYTDDSVTTICCDDDVVLVSVLYIGLSDGNHTNVYVLLSPYHHHRRHHHRRRRCFCFSYSCVSLWLFLRPLNASSFVGVGVTLIPLNAIIVAPPCRWADAMSYFLSH